MAGPVFGLRLYDNWRLGTLVYLGKMEMNDSSTVIDGSDTDFTLGYQ